MRKLLPVLLLFAFLRASAQDTLSSARPVSLQTDASRRKVIATGIAGTILAGSLVSSYFDWWKKNGRPFWFVHEGWFYDYSLGIDKVGHLFTSYFYFNMFRNVLLWGDFDEDFAFWLAAGETAFFAVSIEVGDGLSRYGFSYEDLASNMIGLGIAILRTEVPFMQNFQLKWSYIPPDGYRWPPRPTDHYDGHTYWLTANVHNLLPLSLQSYWPSFVNLGVGYGVSGYVHESPNPQTKRKAVIGLDLNLGVFETDSREVQLLQKTIDMLHLPAPGIRFVQEKKPTYHLFYLH
jgi:hypothetical protein